MATHEHHTRSDSDTGASLLAPLARAGIELGAIIVKADRPSRA